MTTDQLKAKPNRVQLSRKKGFKLPPNTVRVARPSRWGNPFKITIGRSREEAVNSFRTWLTLERCTAGIPEKKQWILDHIVELRGKDLACFCNPGQACHADILLEIANRL